MFFFFGAPHTCPVCTDFRFKRSTQGWFRHVAILIGLVPFRCMHCQTRVWRIAPFTKIPTKRRKTNGPATPIDGMTPVETVKAAPDPGATPKAVSPPGE